MTLPRWYLTWYWWFQYVQPLSPVHRHATPLTHTVSETFHTCVPCHSPKPFALFYVSLQWVTSFTEFSRSASVEWGYKAADGRTDLETEMSPDLWCFSQLQSQNILHDSLNETPPFRMLASLILGRGGGFARTGVEKHWFRWYPHWLLQ